MPQESNCAATQEIMGDRTVGVLYVGVCTKLGCLVDVAVTAKQWGLGLRLL